MFCFRFPNRLSKNMLTGFFFFFAHEGKKNPKLIPDDPGFYIHLLHKFICTDFRIFSVFIVGSIISNMAAPLQAKQSTLVQFISKQACHISSVPHVHTIGVFCPSEWGPDPQCQAAQVAHWTWWWQCLAAWHCRSVWSLPCHFAADAGGLALSVAKSRWHGALRSAHKSCTHGHVFWKKGGVKREPVEGPWTSSRRFSHVLWLKGHSHWLLRACLLGSKRKLPPQACQVRPGLPSVVCHPRGMQFPGTLYICSQGLLSSAWAHCISCAPSACSYCRRCCCCPLQCDRRCMETRLNSAGGPVLYHRWSLSFLHLLSVLSSPLLLSKRASWHIPQAIRR